MKQYYTLLLLLCCSFVVMAQVPTVTEKFTTRDTLYTSTLYADLSMLFFISDDEMAENPKVDMANGAHLRHIVKRSDIDLLFRQNIERDKGGEYSYDHYLTLSAGICKYNNINNRQAVFRKFYPEAIFIFQNNSDRGLTSRFQAGALFYPFVLHRPKFKVNVGIGGVYDWSRWKVNDGDKIADCPQDLQDKIRFINSHTALQYNMYQRSSEFRPMLVLNINLKITSSLHVQLNSLYQQSLVSPYNKKIQDAYPELGKVYPYVITRLEVNSRIHQFFSIQAVFAVDYENNNLALYDSSWQYKAMFGLAFHLHGREL